jgi:hypothetical protein
MENKPVNNGRKIMLILVPVVVILFAAGALGRYAQNNFGSILGSWMAGLSVVAIGILIMTAISKFRQPGGRTLAVLLLALVIVPVGLLGYFLVRPCMMLQPYSNRLDDYRAAARTTKQSSSPYTRGKIVAVDSKANKVDGAVLLALPDELRPSNPDEVATIAWEECDTYPVGSYGGKGSAYQWQCKVTVIDTTDKVTTSHSNTINGSDPPSTSKNGTSQTGSRPIQEIVDYLKSLPRK